MHERRDYTTPRPIKVGTTVAYCERCGCKEFVRLPANDSMRCSACGTEHTYTALLGQITNSARQRAAQAIRDAEALHGEFKRKQ